MKLLVLIAMIALKHGIEPEIFTAIIAQESSFRAVKACRIVHRQKACFATCDWGLAQINDVWIERWKLSPCRLLSDSRYNLEVGARLLKILKRRYGHEEKWWSRYNSAIPKHRERYEQFVTRRLQWN